MIVINLSFRAWKSFWAQDDLTFLKLAVIDIFQILDELLIGSDARKDVQTETCDFTACNGFTYKLDVFEKVETYGECQYPAGKNGRDDDFFCFVNEDSACYKVIDYINNCLNLNVYMFYRESFNSTALILTILHKTVCK